ARRAVEVHHLAFAVDPGIGTAGTHHRYRFIGDRGQRLLQRRLHARPAALAQLLPALEFAAVVLHAQGVTHAAVRQRNWLSSATASARAAGSLPLATSCNRLRAVSVSPRSR